ncbi:MAG: CobD/CbiB family cobalamin biosynthesis protein [Haloferacaceae archaeon]
MPLTATVAVALAAGLDRAVAEPPATVHPVALFGRLVEPLDREWPAADAVGVAVAVVLPLLAAVVAGGLVAGFGSLATVAGFTLSVWLAALAAGLVLFSTASLRLLCATAQEVVAASATDLATARRDLRALAGRDAAALSAGEVRSAAVESAAENLADGLVAPLGAFAVAVALAGPVVGAVGGPVGVAVALPSDLDPAVGALALGAAAAAWIKGVNTLDSMLGYRTTPVGRAPARLDDLAMWLPARASAVLLALAAGDPGALARAQRDARVPASPNSGWPMATLAAVLGCRLAKPDHYALGDPGGSLPDVAVAERGVAVVARAGWLAVALAGVLAWL